MGFQHDFAMIAIVTVCFFVVIRGWESVEQREDIIDIQQGRAINI